jgi:hypothetical protein
VCVCVCVCVRVCVCVCVAVRLLCDPGPGLSVYLRTAVCQGVSPASAAQGRMDVQRGVCVCVFVCVCVCVCVVLVLVLGSGRIITSDFTSDSLFFLSHHLSLLSVDLR